MKNQTKTRYTLSDKEADRFFEEIERSEGFISDEAFRAKYGQEQIVYEATPYSHIQDFLNKFQPGENDIVYDLGSGYGRVVIFGAMNSDAEFRGIELLKERSDKAKSLAKKLGLSNVKFITANVVEYDFSDGDIFFLFNPFGPRTMEQVGEKLREISSLRSIKIATWGGASDDYFSQQCWLKSVKDIHPQSPLEYFVSR